MYSYDHIQVVACNPKSSRFKAPMNYRPYLCTLSVYTCLKLVLSGLTHDGVLSSRAILNFRVKQGTAMAASQRATGIH